MLAGLGAKSRVFSERYMNLAGGGWVISSVLQAKNSDLQCP